MKKTKFKFVNIVLAALLVLNQAVFFVVADFVKATTTDTTHYIMAMEFVSAPAEVSGSANFSVKTSEEAEVVFFILQNGNQLNQYAPIYQGNKIYSLAWNTTTYNNGQYTIKAYATKSGYIDISKQADVIINNPLTTINDTIDYEPDFYEITWLEALQPPLSGDQRITAMLNKEVNKVDFAVEGARSEKYQGIKENNKQYYFIWRTAEFPDNYYKITAHAFVGGEVKVSKSFSSQTKNQEFTDIYDDGIIDDNIVPDALTITIVERLQSPVAGDYRITANVNQPVDKVEFAIFGPRNETFAGVKQDENHYYFVWPTTKFPDGFYKFAIIAYQGTNKVDLHDSIEIKNNYTDTLLPQPIDEYYPEKPTVEYYPKEITQPMAGTTIKQPIIEQFIFDVLPECQKNNINSAEECKKFMSLPPECREKGFLTWEECDKYMMTPPECRDKGLSQEECDKFMTMPPECRMQGILDHEECKKYMFRFAMPWECQQAGATTPEECSKIIFTSSMPYECVQAGVRTKEECDKIMSIQNFLTPECKSADITTPEECDKYMMENHLPPECQEAGITNPVECDYILREKYGNMDNLVKFGFEPVSEFGYYEEEQGMPPECREAGIITPEQCEKIMFEKFMPPDCLQAGATTKEECDKIMFIQHMPPECSQANITDPEECEKHMMMMHMPPECKDAGATSPEECEEIMFKKHAPKECIKAGITTPKECEKFMFKKHAPDDCREAGILNPEACKKYMFEKYGEEGIPADKLPIECQKAGAKTPEECAKVIRKMYMPKECQDQGITDEKECDLYMQQKYMPKECRDAGVTTRQECDKIMFKKYGPRECIVAGIEDEQECEEFMFNKYAPQVTCQGVDDWQCKNSIRNRHLGNIVAKQVQFAELKEKVIQMVGASVTIEDLEATLEMAKEIIPIKEKQTGLKIIAAGERLILDEDENLIQTAPVALMIDSDGDGLSDDMEIRLGTDPNNPDSDSDGYNDGAEMANNYNPTGAGELKIAMAPVDQAILTDKTLGQPKTEGEVSEELAVKSIVNLADEQNGLNQGYNLAGQAEPNSVATLYIYSDLPIVATVQADEYGNWQYEFSKSLIEGEHEIYVAINDNTGKVITKSNPLNFFVKEAKAVSVKDFVAASVAAPTTEKAESMIKYYLIIAILTVVVGILLFVIFIIQKRKQGLKA